jgi:hypothetical protein
MLINWMLIGIAGWASLMLYRWKTGWFKERRSLPASSFIIGFLFSLLLGPFTFMWLLILAMMWMFL